METPGLWLLKPEVVTKPWGLVHRQALDITGIRVGLGEFWLASAQSGPGNYSNAIVEPALRLTLAEALARTAARGDAALEAVLGRPALRHLRENPHRGKTEAWCVRLARGRTGVAAGPATQEDADELQRIIRQDGLAPDVGSWSPEVRRLFGLIEPLSGGEVFLAPAGALHTMFAVGPDSALIIDELQQGYGESLLPTLSKILLVQDDLLSVQVHPDDATVAAAATGSLRIDQDLQANPTVRVYDFGRRPGEYPELGFKLTNPASGLRLVEPVTVQAAQGHAVDTVVADRHFVKGRVALEPGRDYPLHPQYGSYHVLHLLAGRAELCAGNRAMHASRGQTVFVPARLEEELRIDTPEGCTFYDDTFPVLPSLTRFLASHGAGTDDIEALLSPPRAVPAGE